MKNEKTTIVIFETREEQKPEQGELPELLAQRCSGRPDIEIYVVPHLVDIAVDGPVMRQLHETDGTMLVVGPMQARAIHWLLKKNGLKGRFAEVEKGVPGQVPIEAEMRLIFCVGTVGLEPSEVVEACVASLNLSDGKSGVASESQQQLKVERIEETTSTRWYPVVDRDRCTNCLECLNFCLFGVFGLDDNESLAIDQPDACRPGCPACSRICPEGAIMFPDHHDPAISGDSRASSSGLKLDLSQLFGGGDPAAIDPTAMAALERDRALTEKKSVQQKSERKPTNGTRKTDLDDLVDGLDELDM